MPTDKEVNELYEEAKAVGHTGDLPKALRLYENAAAKFEEKLSEEELQTDVNYHFTLVNIYRLHSRMNHLDNPDYKDKIDAHIAKARRFVDIDNVIAEEGN